ncbi:MAG: ABC transporter substrate-binding protein [Patescibacteria group bacterium]|nr:ABC transporter substrate-binding protein [Patescibacteria group bacterium]
MVIFKRRLFFWLLKAYLQRWGKRIIALVVIGAIGFFALLNIFEFLVPKIFNSQKVVIGAVGAYTLDSLPSYIIDKMSEGLTVVSKSGTPLPGAARSWKIEDNGKRYIFYLKKNLYFSDGTALTSYNTNYSFADADLSHPNSSTLVFNLKYPYSPFLITVSQPIFKRGFIGLGQYKIKDIKLDGTFVQHIALVKRDNPRIETVYRFYPTQKALKTAYLLGEVRVAQGLGNADYKNIPFSSFPNTVVKKNTDYSHLVTLFYNTTDKILSDPKIRDALSYAIPNSFPNGLRNYLPLSPYSWAYNKDLLPRTLDYNHARLLLLSSSVGTQSAKLTLKIKTLPMYLEAAQMIRNDWEKLGIKVSVKKVESVPSRFQVFLGSFNLPKDPDQYALWHSSQPDNISNYKNLRIDKLLEDGRRITDVSERRSIYMDFQKYLLGDSPAAFLYFPYTYTLYRR